MLSGGASLQQSNVVVESAPEPSEVLWENLQLDDEHESRVELVSTVMTVLLVLFGLGILITCKLLQVFFNDLSSNSTSFHWTLRMGFSSLMAMVVSTVTLVWNTLCRSLILRMTKRAGHDTLTSEQTSIFGKLSVAYVVNSAVVPILVSFILTAGFGWYETSTGSTPIPADVARLRLVDQSWYENSSMISVAAMLIVLNIITDLMKVVNFYPIFMHYYAYYFAVSQSKQNEMWRPIPFNAGVQYAFTLKSVALGLVYGPIWPFAYLLTSIGLVLAWLCTRFGLRHWYRHPSNVKGDMMMQMRLRVGNVLGLSVMVQCLATYEASGFPAIFERYQRQGQGSMWWDSLRQSTSMNLVYIATPLVLIAYVLLPLGAFESFTIHDKLDDALFDGASMRDEAEAGEVEAGGKAGPLAFEDVTRERGFDMPRYKCPLISAGSLLFDRKSISSMAEASSGRLGSPKAETPRHQFSLGHQASFILQTHGHRDTSRNTNAPLITQRKRRGTPKPQAAPVVFRNSYRESMEEEKEEDVLQEEANSVDRA